jgi:hypothetical protein
MRAHCSSNNLAGNPALIGRPVIQVKAVLSDVPLLRSRGREWPGLDLVIASRPPFADAFVEPKNPTPAIAPPLRASAFASRRTSCPNGRGAPRASTPLARLRFDDGARDRRARERACARKPTEGPRHAKPAWGVGAFRAGRRDASGFQNARHTFMADPVMHRLGDGPQGLSLRP